MVPTIVMLKCALAFAMAAEHTVEFLVFAANCAALALYPLIVEEPATAKLVPLYQIALTVDVPPNPKAIVCDVAPAVFVIPMFISNI
jgi:hypothetical protein